MKIAMLGHKRVPSREGGIEIVVEQLATKMAQQGHSVVCYNRKGQHVSGKQYGTAELGEYKGVKLKEVFTIDKKGLAAVTSSIAATVAAAFSRAEVVHIHAEGPAVICFLPRLFGKKVVVTVHGLDWQRAKWKKGFGAKYIRLGEKMAVKFAHHIIVLSEGVKQYFADTYGRHTVYIPNGVTRPEIKQADEITQRYGLCKDSYILFLGRIVPEKGVHYLAEAFKAVKTDKKLVIAGGSSDTEEYMQQLKDSCKENENIIFTGFVQGNTLQELYSNAYIYVLPSDLEGMPLSLLEAMSFGNCCVVSDIAECTEVVQDRAVVFEKGNTESLAQALQKLCGDKEAVYRYKTAAADYICEKYNWDTVTEKTLKLYSKREQI